MSDNTNSVKQHGSVEKGPRAGRDLRLTERLLGLGYANLRLELLGLRLGGLRFLERLASGPSNLQS